MIIKKKDFPLICAIINNNTEISQLLITYAKENNILFWKSIKKI